MQTPFYTSGFLYSLKTHQILLLKSSQQKDTKYLWSTLGGNGLEGEEAKSAFQRIIRESLGVNLKMENIHPVYDYFQERRNMPNFVFYGEVKDTRKFHSLRKGSPSWVTFNETPKLLFAPGIKQDVIVGERVLNAKWREDEAKTLLAANNQP